MPLIIDCYNLLHHPMPQPLAGLDERRLIQLLAGSAWAAEGVTIVCDGVVKRGGPSASDSPGVELLYSGPRRDADAVIAELIQRNTAPRRLVVVSNDREVQKAARRRRAVCWGCGRFVGELGRLMGGGDGQCESPLPPGHRLSDEEVRAWADEFGVDLDDGVDS